MMQEAYPCCALISACVSSAMDTPALLVAAGSAGDSALPHKHSVANLRLQASCCSYAISKQVEHASRITPAWLMLSSGLPAAAGQALLHDHRWQPGGLVCCH